MSIDLEDVKAINGDEYVIDFVNRPETGTPLKNDTKSERHVTITDDLYGLIEDYKAAHRPDVIDEYGREPLFCTAHQRITRQRAY